MLYFEDVTEGMELSPQEENKISMTTIVKFAGGSGDYAPIHHDVEVAKSRGLDKPIIMAPLKMALLDRFIGDWIGRRGVLHKLSARFRGVDYVGDSLIMKGIVNKKYSVVDKHYVECELWIENKQRGERTTTGKAVVCFPSKTGNKTRRL